MQELLASVLEPTRVSAPTLRAWWEATAATRNRYASPFDRALAVGARADRIGFAFAAGYAEALRALVPGAPGELSALCASEQGGNHPRAIRTRLEPVGAGRFRLTGTKTWATIASEASSLLVVASAGEEAGQNRLRVVRVPVTAEGVVIRARAMPFVPEIPHAEVELAGVEVDAAAVLPGDGYTEYLKPFRTVEDLHVHGALAGYVIAVARSRGFDRELVESLLALAVALRALAAADARAATTHLALAGAIALLAPLVAAFERAWAAAPDEEHARWVRDRPLLQVAGSARAARRERAWAVHTPGATSPAP